MFAVIRLRGTGGDSSLCARAVEARHNRAGAIFYIQGFLQQSFEWATCLLLYHAKYIAPLIFTGTRTYYEYCVVVGRSQVPCMLCSSHQPGEQP